MMSVALVLDLNDQFGLAVAARLAAAYEAAHDATSDSRGISLLDRNSRLEIVAMLITEDRPGVGRPASGRRQLTSATWPARCWPRGRGHDWR